MEVCSTAQTFTTIELWQLSHYINKTTLIFINTLMSPSVFYSLLQIEGETKFRVPRSRKGSEGRAADRCNTLDGAKEPQQG